MPAVGPLTAGNAPLRRMRRLATGLLAAIAAVFVGTHFLPDPPQWVLLIRSMAEAGMVGGLADWFAVEALFRRPLGLPIPHTALLPANQRRAADNVGAFFDEYFMEPEPLRRKLAGIDPARQLSAWLSQDENARFVASQVALVLQALFRGGAGRDLAENAGGFLAPALREATDARTMGRQIATMLRQSLHGDLLDALLEQVGREIAQRRESVVALVRERSRWWIASSVDRKVADLLVDGVISVVGELGDRESDLRAGFEQAIAEMIDRLEETGALEGQIDRALAGFLESGAFDAMVARLIESMGARISESFEQDAEGLTRALAAPLRGFARRLADDPALQEAFNRHLSDLFDRILTRLRPALKAHVTRTIAEWDSDELVDRFESAVGRDLQFIRINGSLLGALIGGGLFFLGKLLPEAGM